MKILSRAIDDHRYAIVLLLTALSLVLALPLYVRADCSPTMADYLAYPPFLVSKVKPNVLLVLDNSGSMDEFAYHEVRGWATYGNPWTGYDPGKEYYGLFNPNKCYKYNNTNHYFYVDGDTVDDPATADIYERSTGSAAGVRKFSGNWLNWWTMRRLDVAKKVLTGGRIAPDTTDTVLEAQADAYKLERRRIFNDYTTATDPHGILTGDHAKNVYYTPFHRGFYSWFFNIDRADHLGGAAGEFAIMFNAVAADFDEVTDLTGGSRVELTFTDPVDGNDKNYTHLADDAAEAGDNLGETGYDYPGYVAALKVEPEDLPVEGIIQKMADRVRFGYMQFNLGTGPGEGRTRNDVYGTCDIDEDGTNDLTWYCADGGRVRNYIGDIATTTDPHGDEVWQIVQNINQQEIQMNTPLEEILWEATRYFQQVAPEFQPENSPDTPPANSVDFEVNDTWDPYYFNEINEFIPCAKSYIIFVSDGEGNSNSGRPTATWPSGANTNDLTSDGNGYLDDIAFNMHTQDLRDDTLMGEAADLIDQTITLYSVFCFDDSTNARCEMMKAARAGGFIDRNGDGDPGGSIHETDPTLFVGDPEWDRDGDNIPDTYFEAQNGAEMEEKIMRAIADILSRSASGTAASVISNARGGEGAAYQAVFFTESEPEPLTGETVRWYGNVHSLFVDSYGNMREDTNENDALDESIDRVVVFDGETAKAKLHDPASGAFDEEVDIKDLKFIWDAHSWLSDPGMDVLTQRVYASTDHQRYIFTDVINTGSSVSMNNVNSPDVDEMDFTPGFANDAANDNYFFLNPYMTYDHDSDPGSPDIPLTEAEMITEAQNTIKYIRGQEGLTQVGTGIPYRNRTLDTTGDSSDDTVFRLADIIHSTPTVVSRPAEDYDLLYTDYSYRGFRKKYLNRRTVAYAGANDGMLHAFNGGFYDKAAQKFEKQRDGETAFDLGAEMWAYVPNAVLAHLKWLKEPLTENTHVYYVDLKPRVFDARIFTPDPTHPGGWGTVLVCGLRLGGAPIGVDTDIDGVCDLVFLSSYFALDITNPEEPPDLLWSFTNNNMGLTTSFPTAIRVGSAWFIVVGSGPDNFDAVRKDVAGVLEEYGGSSRTADLYILDAADGTLLRTIAMNGHSFMSDPIAIDFDLTTDPLEPEPGDTVTWSGEAIYIASDGCGA